MKVLHVTPELPLPGGTGGATRQFHLMRALARRGHEVTVLAPGNTEQVERAGALGAAGIAHEVLRRPASRVRETLAAVGRSPELLPAAVSRPVLAWQVSVLGAALIERLPRTIERVVPDVVSIEHDWAAHWWSELPAELPRVLTLQNVSWRYYEQRARVAAPARRPALRAEGLRFKAFDRRHLRAYQELVAMSEIEAAAVFAALGRMPTVVPNGVAIEDLPAAPPESDGPPALLFTGTMGYPPNAEGVLWLVHEAWPAVRRARPDATLRIVGPDPPAAIRRLAGRDGIEVLGRVPELAPQFAAATLVVAPIRSGAGTRLKVLEGLASGRPVVTTPAGMEGIAAVDGVQLRVAEEPETFARAVLELLADTGERLRLAAAGRRLVEEQYDYGVLGERLERVLISARGRREAG